jgi:hypothetical protein
LRHCGKRCTLTSLFARDSTQFQMTRRCPHCGSTNVRRSGRLDSEATAHPFHSPYRCRDCEQRFWVVSRRTLYGAVCAAVLAIGVMVWSGLTLLSAHDPPAPPVPVSSALEFRPDVTAPATDARVLGDALLRQWGTRLDVPNSSLPQNSSVPQTNPP